VDIRRCLAQSHPDAFLPTLAMSLSALGKALLAGDRAREAAAATREGLTAIAPFVERHAKVFSNLAAALARDHRNASDAAGIEPDIELVERVERALKTRE